MNVTLPSWMKSARLKGAWRRSRWPLLVVGLLVTGGALTYLVIPPTVSVDTPIRVVAADDTVTAVADPMPSVVGLSSEIAALALRDAGLSGHPVKTIQQPAAGAPGRVLAQSPAVGAKVATGDAAAITLTTSAAMATPDLIGKDYKAARSELEKLGAVVRLQQVIRPGSEAGKVLGTTPKKGATLPAVVTLTVADPGEAVSLTDLRMSDGAECDSDSAVSLGSSEFDDTLSCEVVNGASSFAVFALDGKAMTLRFTAGYDTDAGRGTARLRVLGDGKLIGEVNLNSGTKAKTIDVRKVNVLRIEVTGKSDDANNPAVFALGNAQLLGAPDGIASLAGSR